MSDAIVKLQRISHGTTVISAMIAALLVYAAMLFYSIPLVSSHAPGLALFDLSPLGYSFEDARVLLTRLGSEGRRLYLTVQLPLDFIYPGLFAFANALLLTWLLKPVREAESRVFLLVFLPVLAGVFDYLENITILSMLIRFPDISAFQVGVSCLFTQLKSGLTTLFFVSLLWVLLLRLTHRFQ